MNKIQALFFDFDGLILDTETPAMRAWEELYRRYGLTFPFEAWSKVIGGGGEATFDAADYLLRHLPHPNGLSHATVLEMQEALSRSWLEQEQPRPGIEPLLQEAQQSAIRCFVVSSSSRVWVEGHLQRLGLRDYFEVTICADDVPPGRTKPHPDLYLKALERAEINPAQGLALEDSPNGVRAARAAGLRVLAIPNPVTARLAFPVAPDDSLPSLQNITLQHLQRYLQN